MTFLTFPKNLTSIINLWIPKKLTLGRINKNPSWLRNIFRLTTARLPGLLVSACMCTVAVVVQQYYYGNHHHFLVSMALCVIPLGIAIVWNVVLSCSLKRAQKGSRYYFIDLVESIDCNLQSP